MYQRLPYHGHCCSTRDDIGLNTKPYLAFLSLSEPFSTVLSLSLPLSALAFLSLTQPTGQTQSNSAVAFKRLQHDHPEVTANSSDFKFRGRGQRDTPVTDVRGIVDRLRKAQ